MWSGLLRSAENGSARCLTLHFFSIRMASSSEAETRVSTSTQCELLIADGKKHKVFGLACFNQNNLPTLRNFQSFYVHPTPPLEKMVLARKFLKVK